MVMDNKEIITVKTSGTNGDGSVAGSHHLIVELIKTIAELDADGHIISGIEASINVIKNDDVEHVDLEYLGNTNDGSDVTMDMSQYNLLVNSIKAQNAKRRDLFRFLESYATGENKWMDRVHFKDFVDKVMYQLCMLYKKKIIAALLNCPESKLLNGDTIDYHVLNDLFDTLDIPYYVLYVCTRYAVDRK